ncbi:MAG: helicase C-terminal domain-containing protein [Candidatus Korarchaeum sp.]
MNSQYFILHDGYWECDVLRHFPYPEPRKGQLELIGSILGAIEGGGITVIEAPSGLGKTASVLTAISCFSEHKRAKFIYAVRTHSQVSRVMEECGKFSKLRVAALRGKGELCINWRVKKIKNNDLMVEACRGLRRSGSCPYYEPKGVQGPRCYDPLSSTSGFCPYYESIATIRGGNYDALVLCYPYLFDPELGLPMSFSRSEVYLIVDEAHNLRKYWISKRIAVIDSSELEFLPRFRDIVKSLREAGLPYLKLPKDYFLCLLRSHRSEDASEGIVKFLDRAIDEVKSASSVLLEPPNLILVKEGGKKLEEIFKPFKACVLISGTWSEEVARGEVLDDLRYERISMRRWGEVYSTIIKDFTTKFEERSRMEFYRIASALSDLSDVIIGNMGIFTSSYDVLQGILDAGFENMLEKPLFVERRDMDSQELTRMISEFKRISKTGAVLLGVQGGRSSEGEDFPGLQMTTSVIVGMQLAKPNALGRIQEVLWRKFTRLQNPNLINACRVAVQAAARPVRSSKDVGFIVFADVRFSKCISMMPDWMKAPLRYLSLSELAVAAQEFFKGRTATLVRMGDALEDLPLGGESSRDEGGSP